MSEIPAAVVFKFLRSGLDLHKLSTFVNTQLTYSVRLMFKINWNWSQLEASLQIEIAIFSHCVHKITSLDII